MSDLSLKAEAFSFAELSSQAAVEAERRQALRHQFTAGADVVELDTGARFCARTTDLGPGGCFVDTLLPFPVGSRVRVLLTKGETRFNALGTVVYSQPGLGMGIAFGTLPPKQAAALQQWLAELATEREAAFDSGRRPGSAALSQNSNRAVLARLIHLLIGKKVLSEAEGSALLRDAVS